MFTHVESYKFQIMFQSSDLTEVKEVLQHFRLKIRLSEPEEIGENKVESVNIKVEDADLLSEGNLLDQFDMAIDNLMTQSEAEQPEVVNPEVLQPEIINPEVLQPEVVDISDDEEIAEMNSSAGTREEVSPF